MKIYVRFIPMVVIMGMIFLLSHQSGDVVRLPPITGMDKLAHGLAYGLLAGAFIYGLQPFDDTLSHNATAVIVVLFCLLYGISDEYHQSFIPGRLVSFWDVAADTFGPLLVVAWWYRQRAGTGRDNSP